MAEQTGHSRIAVTLTPACTSCPPRKREAEANMNPLFAGMSGESLGRHLTGRPGPSSCSPAIAPTLAVYWLYLHRTLRQIGCGR